MDWRDVRSAMAIVGVTVLVAGCAQFGSDAEGDAQPGGVRAVPTVLVVDSSGSMAEDDAPGPRIDAAKQASAALMGSLPEGTPTALVTYGSNTDDRPESQETSCRDITVLRPLTPVEGGEVGAEGEVDAVIDGLAPGGFTPIGRALEVAAAELVDTDGEKAIVLISDGEDTCGDPTPCEAAREIKRSQPEVTISTIGFKSDVEELACVARETGGLYLTADNVDQLVSRVVAAQNAPAGEAALTPTGRSGIELGQHFDDIRSAHPDFPGQSDGAPEGDLTVIRWVDCDWVFDGDGRLVEIREGQGSTIDGLRAGDPATSVRALYGDPVETIPGSGGEWVAVYPASREAGTAWKISYGSDDEIRTIVLCACLPGSGPMARFKGIPDGVPEWARQPGGPEVEILRPVDSNGVVQPGFTVTESDRVECDGADWAAFSAVEPGTVQCSTTYHEMATECWPDASGFEMYCVGADKHELKVGESRNRKAGQPVNAEYEPTPLFVETGEGVTCRYGASVGRALKSVISDGVTYAQWIECEDGSRLLKPSDSDTGADAFVQSGDRTVATATYDYQSVFEVEITKVTFIGTA